MSYAFEVAALATVSDYDGGAKSLGGVVGINSSVLSHKVCLTDKANHLTVPQARKIMQATGDYRMLYGLAQDLDHICVQTEGLTDDASLERTISVLAKEFGEYVSSASMALVDGTVTPNEQKAIDRELAGLVAAANRLRALCASRGKRGGRHG